MLQLHKRLVEEKKVTDTTATAYIKTLYMLNGKKVFTSLAFLKKTEAISAIIATYAESTQKTMYSVIASILSMDKDKSGYKSVYKYYYNKMMNKAKEAKEQDTSEKTDKQKEAWLSWKDVSNKHAELSKTISSYTNKSLGEDEYDTLLNTVILSLYHDIPPRRNQDFLSMVVYRANKKDKIEELPTDKNYLIITDKQPSKFIFNVYKTSKTYGKQEVVLPTSLVATLSSYIKYHPSAKDKKLKEFPFLVSFTGKALDADNSITRILNKIFGKNVGSSMLRHIYLSDKYDINQMKEDAELMGHSVSQQREYLKAELESSPTSSQSAVEHIALPPVELPPLSLPPTQT